MPTRRSVQSWVASPWEVDSAQRDPDQSWHGWQHKESQSWSANGHTEPQFTGSLAASSQAWPQQYSQAWPANHHADSVGHRSSAAESFHLSTAQDECFEWPDSTRTRHSGEAEASKSWAASSWEVDSALRDPDQSCHVWSQSWSANSHAEPTVHRSFAAESAHLSTAEDEWLEWLATAMLAKPRAIQATPPFVQCVQQQADNLNDYFGEAEKAYYIRFLTLLAYEKSANKAFGWSSLYTAMEWSLAAFSRNDISSIPIDDDIQQIICATETEKYRHSKHVKREAAVDGKDLQQRMNESQFNAVVKALRQVCTIIQGPPGTGKTSVLISIIWWAARVNAPMYGGEYRAILVVCQSHSAVDNIMEKFIDYNKKQQACGFQPLHILRLGSSDSIRSDLKGAERLGAKDQHDGQYRKAHVIFSTALGSYNVPEDVIFPFVVIDEATQLMEPVALVPIVKGAKHLAMVGDTKQLAPTVKCQIAAHLGLNISMFERLQHKGMLAEFLNTQYRMPTTLSRFPSSQFYHDELLDGSSENYWLDELLDEVLRDGFPWPDRHIPICFINVHGTEQPGAGNGYHNPREVAIVTNVVVHLLHKGLRPESIGLAVPYKQQLLKLNESLKEHVPSWAELDKLEVNSVDGYQGREKDLLLMLTTRSNHNGSIGFVADTRRICVAFTRATRGLIVVGNKDTLEKDPTWKAWLTHLKNVRPNVRLIIDSTELQQNLSLR